MTRADRWLGVEVRHLAALRAVVEEESFNRAARRLGYTQSAISQQIAALERVVGARLIKRPGGPKPVSPTDAGELLLRHADRILAALAAAEADLATLLAGGGTVRVGTYQSVGARILPPIMTRFSREWPGVDVRLTERGDDEDLLRLLEQGELDLAFAMLPLSAPFEWLELLDDPYVLLVPAESELARTSEPLTLKQLAQVPLITFRHCRKLAQLERSMRMRGLRPTFVLRSDDNGTIQAMVSTGAGAALMPRLAIAPDDGVALTELSLDVSPRVIVLAWHADRERSEAAKAFAQISLEVATALAGESAREAVAVAGA